MPPFESVTVKVPGEARDVLLDVARVLREKPAFARRLAEVVEEFERPSLAAMLEEAPSRLEA
ncbi:MULTISPECIES: hypothetical protein [unclassified Aureimonas]|uniref:hypothetical protein n=1 Tax=unclassified Aureimonas TaxID=2615206 RepID=UPI0007867445|nr:MULTISPECIES: hypothetical protein [unclassified Aureimonas]